MTIYSGRIVPEKSSTAFVVPFLDEDKQETPPNWITWSLVDKAGGIVNEREDVSPMPASSIIIALQGDDLAILEGLSLEDRYVTIKAEYDSNYGFNKPFTQEIHFQVENLKGIK